MGKQKDKKALKSAEKFLKSIEQFMVLSEDEMNAFDKSMKFVKSNLADLKKGTSDED